MKAKIPFEPEIALIQKKKKRKWWQYAVLAILGIVQISIGCVLTTMSAGFASSLGVPMIIEGAMDIFQSLTAYIKGDDIDWGKYLVGKAISYPLMLVTAGFKGDLTIKNFKDGVNNLKNIEGFGGFFSTLGKNALEAIKQPSVIGKIAGMQLSKLSLPKKTEKNNNDFNIMNRNHQIVQENPENQNELKKKFVENGITIGKDFMNKKPFCYNFKKIQTNFQ